MGKKAHEKSQSRSAPAQAGSIAAAENTTAAAALESPTSGPGDETDMDATLQSLQDQLETESARSREYLDGWQRARAEFANYKKRVEREQSQAYQNAAGTIIRRYLEVLDDLERALKNRPQDQDGATWANGIELIYRKLQTILENEGVKPLGLAGEEFDPNLHEAISSEDNDHFHSGQIIEVLQPGYTLGERVLRPARVRVAR